MFNSNQMFIFCSKYILLLGERKSIQGYGADISYGSWLEQITKSCIDWTNYQEHSWKTEAFMISGPNN